MANNRLYIVDTKTGDKFLLCKSFGYDWGFFWNFNKGLFSKNRLIKWIAKNSIIRKLKMAIRIDAFNYWLLDRDIKAADVGGKNSMLVLKTKYEV